MKRNSRRAFFKQAAKGTVIGLLGFIPGSFFNRKTVLAATGFASMGDETLESVLKRVTKDNLYSELNKAGLSPEEKLAVVSVKEVSHSDISKTLDQLRGKGAAMSSGNVCGSGCGGSCGNTCGSSCSPPLDAFSVVDKRGKLNIKINKIDKSRFRSALEKAVRFQ